MKQVQFAPVNVFSFDELSADKRERQIEHLCDWWYAYYTEGNEHLSRAAAEELLRKQFGFTEDGLRIMEKKSEIYAVDFNGRFVSVAKIDEIVDAG